MSHECDKKKSGKEKIKELVSKYIKVDKLKACDAKIHNAEVKNMNVETLLVDDVNLACILNRPNTVNIGTTLDCVDCDTREPIKPDNLDQDVWDFLTENRNLFLQRTKEDLLRGREDIRCIREAYGCIADCPPDCPIPEDCQLETCPTPNPAIFLGTVVDNVLTITETIREGDILPGTSYVLLTENGNEVGQVINEIDENQFLLTETEDIPEPTEMKTVGCALLPPECIPNPVTCDLSVPLNLYGTVTLPYLLFTESECFAGDTFARAPFNMTYDLDVTNLTCNLATRTITILFHYAYKEQVIPDPGPTPVEPCPPCDEPDVPFECLYKPLGSNINCGVVRYNCKQFYFTINIEIGENFSDNITIPSQIIRNMFDAAAQPVDQNNLTGAFQLAIFVEDGLDIRNNLNARGGGDASPPSNYVPTFREVDIGSPGEFPCCFLAGTQINMADDTKKSIEKVKAGEYVLSYDEKTKKNVIAKVLSARKSPENYDYYYNIEFDDKSHIKVTDDHPFYLKKKGWASINPKASKETGRTELNLDEMKIGDSVKTPSGWKKIIGWLKVDGEVEVYNLFEVEYTHTFYAEDSLVHNKCVAEESLIDMQDGSQKKVEDVKVGDEVLGGKVTKVYKKEMLDSIPGKILENGQKVTGNHVIEHKGEFVKAEETNLTDVLIHVPVYDLETTSGYYYINGIKSKCGKL